MKNSYNIGTTVAIIFLMACFILAANAVIGSRLDTIVIKTDGITTVEYEYGCKVHLKYATVSTGQVNILQCHKTIVYFLYDNYKGDTIVIESFFKNGQTKSCTPKITIENGSLLPIQLAYFYKNYFITEFEINVDRFEIQYSFNGYDYETIETITPKGSGSTYTYLTPFSGYYRLKAIDLDGEFQTFSSVAVVVSSPKEIIKEVSLYGPIKLVFYVNGTSEKILKQ